MKDFIVLLAFAVPLLTVISIMMQRSLEDFWDEHPAFEVVCLILNFAISTGIALAVKAALQ